MPMLVTFVACAALTAAHGVMLPSAHVDAQPASVSENAKWWARVDDQLFFAPPTSMVELSQDPSHYYYAMGSTSALTDAMKDCRVGGNGRWHIFHLPEGPSALQVPTHGDRRESFSSLVQLQHGLVFSQTFPVYESSSGYVHPGSEAAQEKERLAVEQMTSALFQSYLDKVTGLGDGASSTRSDSNQAATSGTVSFLQEELGAMGLTICRHTFKEGGQDKVNVVAFIQGASRDTLTVGAHYDSRPFAGAAPGANDNGSGLSMLLAMAKVYTDMGMRPLKDLYLVGFGAEETGLKGSAAFVPALMGTGETHIPAACRVHDSFLQQRTKPPQHSAFIMDEVGWKSPNLASPTVNMESHDTAYVLLDHLQQSSKDHNGEDLFVVHSNNPFGSDHMSFIDHKLDAVLMINGDDEAYPNYHQSSDTEINVDSEYAAKISKMILGAMIRQGGLQE